MTINLTQEELDDLLERTHKAYVDAGSPGLETIYTEISINPRDFGYRVWVGIKTGTCELTGCTQGKYFVIHYKDSDINVGDKLPFCSGSLFDWIIRYVSEQEVAANG